MAKSFWTKVTGKSLAQGDLLTGCLVPQFEADFGAAGEGATETLALGEQTLIIVTQSCDLENSKVELVAMCPAHTLEEFETINQKFKNKERWEAVRKGTTALRWLSTSGKSSACPPVTSRRRPTRRANDCALTRRSSNISHRPSHDTSCA